MSNKEFPFFAIFIILVIMVNSCRVQIEKTTVIDYEPRKVVLEGHEYWTSNTNIVHSASCPCIKNKVPTE